MSWSTRWRADLARPESPTDRSELVPLVVSAVAIVAVAQLTEPGSALDLVLLTPAVAGFTLRGLHPRLPAEVFAALVIVPVVVVAGDGDPLEGTFFLVVMATLYTSWHLGSLTRALVILVVAVLAPLLVQILPGGSGIEWTPWSSAAIFTFAMGRVLRRQDSLIGELHAARAALADQAVAEERRRIARELHDLAGHTLAAVLLHVTGARHVLRRDLEEAERALVDAETVGRSSLDQIRATVAALRTDERGTDAALAGSADLSELVAEYRRAGLAVSAALPAPGDDLGGPVGTALHRIAREALANVARHAPGNRVELTLARESGEVRLVVADHGAPAAGPDPASGHFGIVGMKERARAMGGRLDAGPTPDGWRVEARLPVTPVEREDRVPT